MMFSDNFLQMRFLENIILRHVIFKIQKENVILTCDAKLFFSIEQVNQQRPCYI